MLQLAPSSCQILKRFSYTSENTSACRNYRSENIINSQIFHYFRKLLSIFKRVFPSLIVYSIVFSFKTEFKTSRLTINHTYALQIFTCLLTESEAVIYLVATFNANMKSTGFPYVYGCQFN